ncbi:hypothetical protein EC396_08160 [Lutibacter sp. HS1-25]|uniref:hypothetical protein n=1 Tax=Lutibacter sp. HS1-25 TaxID=2485000 RepID=UPI00101130EE|nr:hypothetical protein [Lutibacter sp. HS1-25]RXP55794.1 hypothetical protein EC396_08160 [Lutibacter sp. HS1-25]
MLFHKNKTILYTIAFTLFILASLYGLLIRWNFAFPIMSFPYKNVLQSHSHVAFLGWGYIFVITLISECYLTKIQQKSKLYSYSFVIALLAVCLMLVSFPLGGYKVFSIVLLSVFGLSSYIVSFKLLRFLKGNTFSLKFIKYGIYYYLLSSLATWFLAFVLITQGKSSLYYNTVYFYLHFLYNGFFVFALFGLLFKLFENKQILISTKLQQNFFSYLNIACIPAYVLSVLWSGVSMHFYIVGFIAAILQFISLFFLIKIVKQVWQQLKWNAISKLLFKVLLLAYTLKIIMQICSSIPYFVEKALALKPFLIIGYLHLFTLGFMSAFIFLLLNEFGKIELQSKMSTMGVYLFLLGVLFTEVLLFGQGLLMILGIASIENYNLYVLIVSMIVVLGLSFIYANQLKQLIKKPNILS